MGKIPWRRKWQPTPVLEILLSGKFHVQRSLTGYILGIAKSQRWLSMNMNMNMKDLGKIVQFSRSVVSNSLQPHGLKHTRPPHPSPTPGVYSNSRPLSWWCHPTISSSMAPFSSLLQSFPTSGSFQMSQCFTSSGQSIGSFSISPSSGYSGLMSFRMDWFDLLSVQGTLKSLLQHHSSKASLLQSSAFFMVQLSHIPMWLLGKPWLWLTEWTFVSKVMSLAF